MGYLSHGRAIMTLRTVFLVCPLCRRRWDGFITRVHTLICAWAPAAMSLRARHLRPPLPESLDLAMFIHCGKLLGVFNRAQVSTPGQ
jgi:hypothetical protein